MITRFNYLFLSMMTIHFAQCADRQDVTIDEKIIRISSTGSLVIVGQTDLDETDPLLNTQPSASFQDTDLLISPLGGPSVNDDRDSKNSGFSGCLSCVASVVTSLFPPCLRLGTQQEEERKAK